MHKFENKRVFFMFQCKPNLNTTEEKNQTKNKNKINYMTNLP